MKKVRFQQSQTAPLTIYIGGAAVPVAVTNGDTAAAMATRIVAAVTEQADLPLTASVASNVITMTAKNKGEIGNIDIRTHYYPGDTIANGLTLTIAQTVTGAGNPDINDALTAIGLEQYITIICPWTDAANLTALETELDERFGAMQQTTGHAFIAKSGTHAELTTFGTHRNSVHVSCWGINKSPTPDYIRASIWAAEVEKAGSIDPARPFQTLTLPRVLPPAEADRFTRQERNLLLHKGISTTYTAPGGVESIERVITLYQRNQYGIADTSLLDLNTKWTVDYIRYAIRARIAMRYPRHKLADDGTQFAPGQPVATPKILTGELLVLFSELEQAGLVENFDQFKKDLIVVRSTSDKNRVNAIIPPDIINQLRVFAASVQFRL